MLDCDNVPLAVDVETPDELLLKDVVVVVVLCDPLVELVEVDVPVFVTVPLVELVAELVVLVPL